MSTPKARKGTAESKVADLQTNIGDIEPPLTLTAVERRKFNEIIGSRELGTWMPSDIVAAARLARIMVESDKVWKRCMKEPEVIENAQGNLMENPRYRIYTRLCAQEKNLVIQLGLSANQRGVAGASQHARNQKEHATRSQNHSGSKISSLIQRPNA